MTLLTRAPVRCAVLVALLVLLFAPVPIPWRVLVLAGAALVWTRVEAGTLAPLGLGRHGWRATLGWAAGLFLAGLISGELVQPAVARLFGTPIDYSGYGALAGNADAALRLLGYALTSAAIGEEVLFRGFLLHQLVALLGPGTAARRGAIAAAGALFGAAHYIQGAPGMLSTGLFGMLLGWAWFRSGRNLWALILAHAAIDSYGIAMLYLGRYA